MLIITMRSISRKLCVRLFTLWKISTAISFVSYDPAEKGRTDGRGATRNVAPPSGYCVSL